MTRPTTPIPITQTVALSGGRGRLAPKPAASLARIDKALGRPADVNDAWRSPAQADANYAAWIAFRDGYGPPAPFALPAKDSIHCRGYAVDSDDWYHADRAAVWRDHGWRQTARYPDQPKKDEPWHGEYFEEYDNHKNDSSGSVPAPAPDESEEDDMANPRQIHYTAKNGAIIRALIVPGTGYFVKWTEGGATYANAIAKNMETNSSTGVTESLFNVFEREAAALRPKDALSIDLATT